MDDRVPRDTLEGLHFIMCMGKYAPSVIEGEIISEDEDELRIEDDQRVVYHIQKNAEGFDFLDATEISNSQHK